MKAVRFHTYGDASVLQYEDAPTPIADDDEVLIKVHSAGVNPADTQFRRGDYQAFVPLPLPFTLGSDVAGTIASVGSKVSAFKAGDQVFAMADMGRPGAYAEYIAVRASVVAPAPVNMPLEHAAGVPLAALTAWAALFDPAPLQAGQTVLIHAGAGGVGLFAIQLARRAGAHVIATASAANHDLLRQLGANKTIDYRGSDFAAELSGVDLVLDTIGGETRTRSWAVLKPGGMMATIAMPPSAEATAQGHGVRTAHIAVMPHGERLREIAGLIEAGELQVVIAREFALSDAIAAHRYSEERHARGKIILRVS